LEELNQLENGDEKTERMATHNDWKDELIERLPKPVEEQFKPLLLPSDSIKIAAVKVLETSNKTLAESALLLFKKMVGPNIADKMACIDKAKCTLDLILQYQHSTPAQTVALLTADMNALLPATSVKGGLLLYNQMSFLQKALAKIGQKYKWDDIAMLATIQIKLKGDCFSQLKFYHQQTADASEPTVRNPSDFGKPVPVLESATPMTWSTFGKNLKEIAEPKLAPPNHH
jgi:hypothetical protein